MARAAALCGVAAVALTLATPTAAVAQSDEHATAVARAGVVLVTVHWHGWVRDRTTGEVFGGVDGYDVETACGGIVVNPDGYVVTASRCVHTGPEGGAGALFEAAVADLDAVGRAGDPAGARKAMADRAVAEGAVADRPVERRIQVERMEVDAGGKLTRDVAPATVVDLLAPTDGNLAVLKVPRDHLPSLELRPDPPPVDMPVLAIGHVDPVDRDLVPSGKGGGAISAHRTEGGRRFYDFTASTGRMIGGPLVDQRGRVVGVVTSNAVATSTSTLVDLLRTKGITATSGPQDRNFRTGLDLYFDDDPDAAVEYFDAVLAAVPGHRLAAEYRGLAVEQGGTAGGGPALPLVLAVLGWSLATAVGVALLLVRRSHRPVSTVDGPLPVGLGVDPEPDGDGDADQAERRERALGVDDADDQAQHGGADVEPGAPAPGGPRPAERDEGDGAHDGREDHRA
ncbi:serine protease [Umezawaea endophytica]|uniref:Serine protease n=1 Tax=Umezawaea endophytica TaxID=1654476 RepID=A0A9X2VK96_9PSEU|nr:serine protease [Umezawaea endophytica]MCS7478180.1 serine protease [Umezawaea endophytica]